MAEDGRGGADVEWTASAAVKIRCSSTQMVGHWLEGNGPMVLTGEEVLSKGGSPRLVA